MTREPTDAGQPGGQTAGSEGATVHEAALPSLGVGDLGVLGLHLRVPLVLRLDDLLDVGGLVLGVRILLLMLLKLLMLLRRRILLDLLRRRRRRVALRRLLVVCRLLVVLLLLLVVGLLVGHLERLSGG